MAIITAHQSVVWTPLRSPGRFTHSSYCTSRKQKMVPSVGNTVDYYGQTYYLNTQNCTDAVTYSV